MSLNNTVWCKLAPSPIHGIGVFAIRNIKKGQKLYCQSNRKTFINLNEELLPEIEEIVRQRWPLAFEGDLFLSPNDDARLISFMNHSNDPNYDKYNDVALRDITKGEEITEDYGYDPTK